jgi:hypothetical protein
LCICEAQVKETQEENFVKPKPKKSILYTTRENEKKKKYIM